MQTLQANGTSVSAAHVIVPTFGAIALLVNTMLPYLGYTEASAPCTLVLACLFVMYLVVTRPLFSVSLLYMMVLALTAFVAGVGIESGGLMIETGVRGEPNGAFSRLLVFYVIFIGFSMVGFRWFVRERTSHVPRR